MGFFSREIFINLSISTIIVNLIGESILQVSFDDVCHMDSVITRVAMSEFEPERFAISRQHIKQTRKLLREALAAEHGDEDIPEEGAIKNDSNENTINGLNPGVIRVSVV